MALETFLPRSSAPGRSASDEHRHERERRPPRLPENFRVRQLLGDEQHPDEAQEAGDDDVFRKVRGDFDAKGVDQSDHQIRRTMEELMAEAIEQIRNEG